jgi:hypothetical protein
VITVPDDISDDEPLNRRIHPAFVRPDDGRPSSQAFTDPEMSVDRADYWPVEETLRGYPTHGVASIQTKTARDLKQEVVQDKKDLLHPAHALVKGKKTKAIQRKLALAAAWVKRPS